MAKRGFVADKSWNLILTYKWKTELAEDINSIFSFKVETEGEYEVRTIRIEEKHLIELRNTISKYLARRNNEEPDYGIDWSQSFRRDQVFTKIVVMGTSMELFSGNEDLSIHCLAKLYNKIRIGSLVFLFGAMNRATYEFTQKMKKINNTV